MKFATLLSFGATAYGLAFDGPLPTPVTDLVYQALTGWTPKPTNDARSLPELFRRQQKPNSAVCGYLNGDSDFPVSCTAGSCIFNTSLKWFGCCTGTGTASCEMMTRCVESASVSKCLDDASCYNDPLAMACTASSAPHCINMFAKITEGTMNHWVCGATATSIAVATSSVAQSSGSASVKPSSVKSATASVTPGASAIQQGAIHSTVGGAAGVATATGASPSPATGGSAMLSAQSMLGLAGGLAGAFAIFL